MQRICFQLRKRCRELPMKSGMHRGVHPPRPHGTPSRFALGSCDPFCGTAKSASQVRLPEPNAPAAHSVSAVRGAGKVSS